MQCAGPIYARNDKHLTIEDKRNKDKLLDCGYRTWVDDVRDLKVRNMS
jgi:hypothetical protein